MTKPESQNIHEGRIGQPVPTSGAMLTFDIGEQIRRLHSEPWQAEHTANTIVKYPDLRVVLIAFKAGSRLHEHKTAGRISIQTISGDVLVHAQGQVINLPAGHLLTLDIGVSHDVEAKVDSAILVTIAWPKGEDEQGE